jgi:hypothetical protein
MSDRRLQRICTFNISIAPYYDLSPPTRISTRPSGLEDFVRLSVDFIKTNAAVGTAVSDQGSGSLQLFQLRAVF